jgi:hypothetical protein
MINAYYESQLRVNIQLSGPYCDALAKISKKLATCTHASISGQLRQCEQKLEAFKQNPPHLSRFSDAHCSNQSDKMTNKRIIPEAKEPPLSESKKKNLTKKSFRRKIDYF